MPAKAKVAASKETAVRAEPKYVEVNRWLYREPSFILTPNHRWLAPDDSSDPPVVYYGQGTRFRRPLWYDSDVVQRYISRDVMLPQAFWDMCGEHGYMLGHFPRWSSEHEGQIAYFQSFAHGLRGRLTAIRPGRYIQNFYGDKLASHQIAELVGEMDGSNAAKALRIARTREECAKVYINGPSSCMQGSAGRFASSPIHPAEVYAGPNCGVAYLGDPDKGVSARAVVTFNDDGSPQGYNRIYGDSSRLTPALRSAGFRHTGTLAGAKLLKIPTPSRPNTYVMPYLDGSAVYVREIANDPEHFEAFSGGGDFDLHGTTYGITPEAPFTCPMSNRRVRADAAAQVPDYLQEAIPHPRVSAHWFQLNYTHALVAINPQQRRTDRARRHGDGITFEYIPRSRARQELQIVYFPGGGCAANLPDDWQDIPSLRDNIVPVVTVDRRGVVRQTSNNFCLRDCAMQIIGATSYSTASLDACNVQDLDPNVVHNYGVGDYYRRAVIGQNEDGTARTAFIPRIHVQRIPSGMALRFRDEERTSWIADFADFPLVAAHTAAVAERQAQVDAAIAQIDATRAQGSIARQWADAAVVIENAQRHAIYRNNLSVNSYGN